MLSLEILQWQLSFLNTDYSGHCQLSSWQMFAPQAKKEKRKLKGKGKGKGKGKVKGKKSKGKGKARGRGRGNTFQARTSLKRKRQKDQEEDDAPHSQTIKVDNDNGIDNGFTSNEVPNDEEAGTKHVFLSNNRFVLMVYCWFFASGHAPCFP